MMGDRYGIVHAKFWTDDKVQTWDSDTKVMALYLMTGPHATIAGAMRLPSAYIAADLGWPVKKVLDTLSILYREGFATHCVRSNWVVISRRLTYDRPKSAQQFKGVLNVLRDVPDGHPCWHYLMPQLQALSEQLGMPLPFERKSVDRVSEGYADEQAAVAGVYAASVPVSVTVPVKIRSTEPARRSRLSSAAPMDSDFEEFYAAYPRKVGRAKAAAAYAKARQLAEPAAILGGLRTAIAGWKAKGTKREYIPHPASWLGGERWNDEPDATLPILQPRTSGYGAFV